MAEVAELPTTLAVVESILAKVEVAAPPVEIVEKKWWGLGAVLSAITVFFQGLLANIANYFRRNWKSPLWWVKLLARLIILAGCIALGVQTASVLLSLIPLLVPCIILGVTNGMVNFLENDGVITCISRSVVPFKITDPDTWSIKDIYDHLPYTSQKNKICFRLLCLSGFRLILYVYNLCCY